MKQLLPLVFLLLAFFMEATFLSLPLTLLVIFLWYVVNQEQRIFVWAFVFGFLLDVLLVGSIGLRSIFFVLFIVLLFFYERKFEIQTLPFIFFASFFGSLVYGFIFLQGVPILFMAMEVSALAVILVVILGRSQSDDSRIDSELTSRVLRR